MLLPMDETLAQVVLDISGRSFLVYNCELKRDTIGTFSCEMVEEFLRAFAFQAGITLHVNVVYGTNDHHKVEAIFKALGRALKIGNPCEWRYAAEYKGASCNMIAILDYGMGNLHSVENALQHIGCTCCVTDKKEDLQRADQLILPGVGAFADCMKHLQERDLELRL